MRETYFILRYLFIYPTYVGFYCPIILGALIFCSVACSTVYNLPFSAGFDNDKISTLTQKIGTLGTHLNLQMGTSEVPIFNCTNIFSTVMPVLLLVN